MCYPSIAVVSTLRCLVFSRPCCKMRSANTARADSKSQTPCGVEEASRGTLPLWPLPEWQSTLHTPSTVRLAAAVPKDSLFGCCLAKSTESAGCLCRPHGRCSILYCAVWFDGTREPDVFGWRRLGAPLLCHYKFQAGVTGCAMHCSCHAVWLCASPMTLRACTRCSPLVLAKASRTRAGCAGSPHSSTDCHLCCSLLTVGLSCSFRGRLCRATTRQRRSSIWKRSPKSNS